MRSLEEIKEENGGSNQPKEEKKIDYLGAAKGHQNDVSVNNSRAVERAMSCALIFIGEQLERIASATEKENRICDAEAERLVFDEAIKIWGVPENDG